MAATKPRVNGGKSKSLAINLALAAVSTVFFAALLEIGVRAFGVDGGFFLLPSGPNCLRRDPLLSMSFRPGCRGELAGTPVRTNALGLRGPELRDDGSVRILAAGDSCTWGWQVAEGESYPSAERLLRRDRDPEPLRGGGTPRAGHTTSRSSSTCASRGPPSPAITSPCFNDVFRRRRREQIESERAVQPFLRVDDFLLTRSSVYRWARWRAEEKASATREARVSVARYERNLERLVAMGREHGAKVMIVSFWGGYVPEQDYRHVVLRVAKKLKVPLVTYDGERIDAVHPTVEGYATLAKRVANRLVFEAWVQ